MSLASFVPRPHGEKQCGEQCVCECLQGYSTLDSLQQIVKVTDQSVSYYTFALLTVSFQSESYIALFRC